MTTERAEGQDAAELPSRVRDARRRLSRSGPALVRQSQPAGDFERVTVPERDCDALRDVLVAEQVETVVEIGLAYGSSALAIGEALATVDAGAPHHVVIDPMQMSEFAGTGWETICAAGLDRVSQLVLEPSHVALPRLLAEGFTADAGFVDGSHRFHEVFLDLYYLRKIVRPGGLIVLDDHWWTSVATAARYYHTYLGWEPVLGLFDHGTRGPETDQPRMRAYRLPQTPLERGFKDFEPL